jgi:CHAT domain-containing protein
VRSIFRKALKITVFAVLGLTLAVLVIRVLILTRPASPDAQLEEADKAAWLNAWIPAEPLYKKAEASFLETHELSKALYAHVSQMPAHMETGNLQEQIWILTQDLALPEARDPLTRLRILVIRGMIEVNYDAATARSTWAMVESLAKQRHQYLLASRAMGEQGIAAFLLGDIATAKRQVLTAWTLAKYGGDPATQIRYASVYGSALVQFEKYKESLGPLDEAIQLSKRTPGAAYPSIATTAKIEALSGLDRNTEALALAQEALRYPQQHQLEGNLYQVLSTRGGIYERIGKPQEAISDYIAAKHYASNLGYWRGLSEVGGVLAQQYELQGQLQIALTTIDEAIQANKRIPDELYFVPRNLAIKAEIIARLGHLRASNELYEKSADLIDSLLKSVPTPTIERNLLAQLSRVYSGYFSSLCNQDRYPEAFRVIEKARGRVEAQALQHHVARPPHQPTQAEDRLTKLNIQLLDTDEPKMREQLSHAILEAEQQLEPSSLIEQTALDPVRLSQLQKQLLPSELLLEYVLDEPHSYVLAVTGESVNRYALKGRAEIERLSTNYRSALRQEKTDAALAGKVFDELLGSVPEYTKNKFIIVIPDGDLHLLPFSALVDAGQYTITSHTFSTVPSGTVLAILRRRSIPSANVQLPYVGVAAWTMAASSENFILRAISGPARSQLVPLPESRREVEIIAADLPKPSTILLGTDATETRFKELPLNQYNVLHLALHAYADLDYPDRSALAFAPQRGGSDDGLLQVREIRRIPLTASLVTLSACNTGVGPVGQAGVNNIVNAFVEAGAKSVVSTLWETEDHATTQLMQSFYKHLARDEEKADSLRQAQLEMLNSGSPPYYWASFELVGEPHGTLNDSNQTRASIQKGYLE